MENNQAQPAWVNNRVLNNYDYFIKLLTKKLFVYNKTGNYYGTMNMYLVVPSLCITTMTSIFSFLSNSDMFNNDTQKILITIVGISSIFSTMMQSLGGAFGYSTKKEMFLQAADEYDKILMKIQFEKNNPNEENFLDIIEKEITKIEEMCKYLPPNWIVKEWEDNNPTVPIANQVNIQQGGGENQQLINLDHNLVNDNNV
jgi:hypothetical protein